ncbi:MAG: DUF475 domain-containing protein [Candidatus Bathyarchaeota archaeon]|nr:DUF475 domain-containing protein [Candidatus Bathyarchaeota archaeon]
MSLVESVAIVLGLIVFEVVNSVDNAIVNASVLKTMSVLWRKRFLFIGILTSVFLVRFILPLIIVWISVPTISGSDLFLAFIGQSEVAANAIEMQKPLILMFGGVFLLYLYFHWLFLEPKEPLFIERYLKQKQGVWFFAFAAIILVVVMYLARADSMVMLAAAIGSATFFILYGLKQTAEESERNLVEGTRGMSDFSKFVYLEVLDMTFSFDGVIGAFAFTINLILILIGIGIGAIVVRELTIKGIDSIAKYKYLKNGALTSIGFLGFFMVVEAFNIELPSVVPIIVTFALVGVAFYLSRRALNKTAPQS